ncbi:MAG: hypothetical protein A3K19_13365 [Lentisphaerae bacterium RIFOXYB12_FULL_65_16]|nr:MAG: hypothetical protein A3K18_28885 [Lentisphaerae bacterium RIFOXYA12_64_32]OGV86317.1 MAG: hypothetical protein A3K19_13365 [Lentisphaerae bacterium RIFOXYB12_FULL_65_16]
MTNLAWCIACLPGWLRFLVAIRSPRRTQERLLRTLLRRHRDTAFGRGHGFGGLQTPAEFAARVPLAEYADFAPAVAAIRRGEPSSLTAEPVLRLQPTSGSTGAAKLIPYTASLRREYQAAVQAWIAWLYLAHPRLFLGRQYWSISPNTPVAGAESVTPGAVPVGFADDTEYLGGLERVLARQLLAVSPEIRRVTDRETFEHLTLLFLLRARDLRLISVWHASFLTLLLEAMPRHLPALAAELRSGRIDPALALTSDLRERLQAHFGPAPARADEVVSIAGDAGRGMFRRLWPELAVISCWTDGRASPWVERLREWFPDVCIQGKGLLATEGVVSIPTGCGRFRVGAVRSHFFEFIDLATEEVRFLWELELGRDYSVVLTTGGGLWRYRLHDVVRVTGFCQRTPCFAFQGKDNAVSDVVGEKLDERHAAEALRVAESRTGLHPAFAMLAPVVEGARCGYALFLELAEGEAASRVAEFSAVVEEELCRNYHYAHARQLGQLAAVEVRQVRGDAMAAYRAAWVARGMKAGDIKPVALRPETFWADLFGRADRAG